jgi:hypothetical protein
VAGAGLGLAAAAVLIFIWPAGQQPERTIARLILISIVLLLGRLLVSVLIPGVIFIVESAAFIVASGFSLILRVLFRFPFRVEARPSVGESRVLTWSIVGLHRSERFVEEVATAIARGEIHVLRAPT